MAYAIRVFLNQGLRARGDDVETYRLDDQVALGGEFTSIASFQFQLGWDEGDREHPSKCGPARIIIMRRITGTSSDVLADIALAGPSQRGDAYVIKGRVYEIDTGKPSDKWASVVNEWQLGRVVVTYSSIALEEKTGHQQIELSCTDLRLVAHVGRLPSCPTTELLSDSNFIIAQ